MKGICFKEPLFDATIEGRKTQTRRIINMPSPQGSYPARWVLYSTNNQNGKFEFVDGVGHKHEVKPCYQVGDVLYLKEPYFLCDEVPGLYYDLYRFAGHELPYTTSRWKNKLFMPESAARYFIKITAVRAEKLQDISDEDYMREGCRCLYHHIDCRPEHANYYFNHGDRYKTPREAYASLIDKINGRETWNSNPWVWVYDYELTTKK